MQLPSHDFTRLAEEFLDALGDHPLQNALSILGDERHVETEPVNRVGT